MELDWPLSIVYTAVLALVAYLWWTSSQLKDIPGPFIVSLTNFRRLLWTWGNQPFLIIASLHREYGSIVRLGPNVVSIADVSEMTKIYDRNYLYDKSDFYEVLLPWMDGKPIKGMISPIPAELHKKLKGPPSRIFASGNVLQFETLIDSSIDFLIKRIDELFLDEQVCDLALWTNLFAFDTMGMLTFSQDYGHMESGTDVNGIIAEVDAFFDKTSLIGQIPWYELTLQISALQSKWLKQPDSPQITFQIKREMERQALLKQNKLPQGLAERDLLSQFLRAEAADPSTPPGAARIWTATNIGAGSGTTAAALTALLYFIARYPETYAKITTELRSANLLSPSVSSAPSPSPSWTTLPYLNACIREAERLHPGIGLNLERKVPKGGAVICGHFLREGTVVGMNPWVVAQDRGVFGEDAEVWRPERWLVGEMQRRKMEGTLLNFGAGSRLCYGKHIARLIVGKTAAALLGRYKITVIEPEKWRSEGRWFTRQKNAFVKFESLDG